jgi:hypothetical protein
VPRRETFGSTRNLTAGALVDRGLRFINNHFGLVKPADLYHQLQRSRVTTKVSAHVVFAERRRRVRLPLGAESRARDGVLRTEIKHGKQRAQFATLRAGHGGHGDAHGTEDRVQGGRAGAIHELEQA